MPGSLPLTRDSSISLNLARFKMGENCTTGARGCRRTSFVCYVSRSWWAALMGLFGFLLRGLSVWFVGPLGPWEL